MPKPSTVESTKPHSTFPHSVRLMPPKPFCSAMAAPESPAINAWLSLVGMPKYHAAVAQITMAVMAAHSAMSALRVSLPKSTML